MPSVCAQSVEPSVVPRQCAGAADDDSLPRGTGKVLDLDVTIVMVCAVY